MQGPGRAPPSITPPGTHDSSRFFSLFHRYFSFCENWPRGVCEKNKTADGIVKRRFASLLLVSAKLHCNGGVILSFSFSTLLKNKRKRRDRGEEEKSGESCCGPGLVSVCVTSQGNSLREEKRSLEEAALGRENNKNKLPGTKESKQKKNHKTRFQPGSNQDRRNKQTK